MSTPLENAAALITYTDPQIIQSSGIVAGTTTILAFDVPLNFRRMRNGKLDGDSDLVTARYTPGRDLFARVQYVNGKTEDFTWTKLFKRPIMPVGARFRVAKFVITHKSPIYDTERFSTQLRDSIDLNDFSSLGESHDYSKADFSRGVLIQSTLPLNSDECEPNAGDNWSVLETDNPELTIHVAFEVLSSARVDSSNGFMDLVGSVFNNVRTSAASVMQSISQITKEAAPIFSQVGGIISSTGSFIEGIGPQVEEMKAKLQGTQLRALEVHTLINVAYKRKGFMNHSQQENILITGQILPISVHSDLLNSVALWNNSRSQNAFDRLAKYEFSTGVSLQRMLELEYTNTPADKVLQIQLTLASPYCSFNFVDNVV